MWHSVARCSSQCVALSTTPLSTEAEIIALSKTTQEVVGIRKIMRELEGDGAADQPTFIFCDNKGAVDLVKNNMDSEVDEGTTKGMRKAHDPRPAASFVAAASSHECSR